MNGRRVLLGVCGGIAAYKAAALASRLVQAGAELDVILTAEAQHFVGVTTFAALARRKVWTSMFERPEEIPHIALVRAAEVLVIVPATANTIAKLAQGIADDLLSNAALAARIPLIVGPAMNSAMLEHPATAANLRTLEARSVTIVPPESGFLAERETGNGRLAGEDAIVAAIESVLARTRDLNGERVLITAGPTREPIDPVRFLSNASTGTMGIELAREALARGAAVDLVLGPTSVVPPDGAQVARVTTAREMEAATLAHAGGATIAIATAAVADWRPAETHAGKVKKTDDPQALRLERNPDISGRSWAPFKNGLFLVGFAAETDAHEANAREKLVRKHLDAIAVNDVSGRTRSLRPRRQFARRAVGRRTDGVALPRGVEARAGRRPVGRDRSRSAAKRAQLAGRSAIDIGNTETKLGAFDDAGALAGTWRITTAVRRTADEYGILFSSFFSAAHFAIGDVAAIVVSSVVPVVERPLFEGCEKYFGVKPLAFTAAKQTILPIRTERAADVGADLIAAGIAARELVGAPSIVINFGTATTYGAIDAEGGYLGVAIAPGLQVSLDALVGLDGEAAPGRPAGTRRRDRPRHGDLDPVGHRLRRHRGGRGDRGADAGRGRRRRPRDRVGGSRGRDRRRNPGHRTRRTPPRALRTASSLPVALRRPANVSRQESHRLSRPHVDPAAISRLRVQPDRAADARLTSWLLTEQQMKAPIDRHLRMLDSHNIDVQMISPRPVAMMSGRARTWWRRGRA